MACSHRKRIRVFETENPTVNAGKEKDITYYTFYFCPSCKSVTSTIRNKYCLSRFAWQKAAWVNPKLLK